jgi:hypothetical protein
MATLPPHRRKSSTRQLLYLLYQVSRGPKIQNPDSILTLKAPRNYSAALTAPEAFKSVLELGDPIRAPLVLINYLTAQEDHTLPRYSYPCHSGDTLDYLVNITQFPIAMHWPAVGACHIHY